MFFFAAVCANVGAANRAGTDRASAAASRRGAVVFVVVMSVVFL